jgi:hypothetical protein
MDADAAMAMTPATSNERCVMVSLLQGARKRSRGAARE